MNKPKVLIVDDDHCISEGAGVRLRAAGYDTLFAHDGREGLAAANQHHPNAIVLDVRMPVVDGLTALSELKRTAGTKDIPVIMLSASVVDEKAALDAGARFFIRKPFAGRSLVEAVDAALPVRVRYFMNPTKKTILIAEDDRDLLGVLEQRCRQLGLEVVTVEDAVSALNAAIESRPDVICMDVELPGGNGLAASDMFLSDERFAAVPVIVITGKKDHEVQRRCHELSAYYVPKTADTWSRLEPLLCELLGLPPIGERRPGTELVACEIGDPAMRAAPPNPSVVSRSRKPPIWPKNYSTLSSS